MNIRSYKKILIMFILLLILVSFIANASFAVTGLSWGKRTNEFEVDVDDEIETPLNDIAGTVITVTQIICGAIAIVMLSILGMKYMYSSPGERAEIKKHAVIYVIGAFILFAVPGIIRIIIDFSEVFNK